MGGVLHTMGWKLALVILAFVAILATVIWFAFRERRLGRNIGVDDVEAQQASDARVLAVIFSAIVGGMLLTLLVAYIVFF
jgi:membrane protein implicated in regulation of membrane protease activity